MYDDLKYLVRQFFRLFCRTHPRALVISASDLPCPRAISTKALEMASLVPSCMSAGSNSTPSF